MVENSAEGADVDFEQAVQDGLDALPAELRRSMSNVTIVVSRGSGPVSFFVLSAG